MSEADDERPQPQGGADTLRTLQEEEHREREYIRKELYSSLLNGDNAESGDEPSTKETLRMAKEAREELNRAAFRPLKDKAAGFRLFAQNMRMPHNQRVASVFLLFSVLMLTVPILILLIGMHIVAPFADVDPGTCGGLMAVFSTIVIMTVYVVYSLREAPLAGEAEAINPDKKQD
ncbi:hypothetical protein DPX39_090061300 [Trypanosoma brucei equiperdum]|uniref:Uncharacterized protein n=1 Tax=Trypanosoma brucei equiperdum TaxID=630700 RepID=A0A3L6L4A8_9TRYP|nr:hypothetical protein DPX39_090061300 [Trypanosoma brucei equiperdum]